VGLVSTRIRFREGQLQGVIFMFDSLCPVAWRPIPLNSRTVPINSGTSKSQNAHDHTIAAIIAKRAIGAWITNEVIQIHLRVDEL
jgi:hypothetical protein